MLLLLCFVVCCCVLCCFDWCCDALRCAGLFSVVVMWLCCGVVVCVGLFRLLLCDCPVLYCCVLLRSRGVGWICYVML